MSIENYFTIKAYFAQNCMEKLKKNIKIQNVTHLLTIDAIYN